MNQRSILSMILLLVLLLLPAAEACAYDQTSLPQPVVRAYGGTVLAPVRLSSLSGDSIGELTSLRRLDQSGTEDVPASYVMLTTPGVSYRGIMKYRLPSPSLRSSIDSLRLKVNYKGPPAAAQAWRWFAYNWNTSGWTKIGTNARALGNVWTALVFTIPDPQAYVDSTSGALRIMLRSSSAEGNARIDFQGMLIRYSEYKLGYSPDLPAGCPIFPLDNVWNTPVDTLAVHARSAQWIDTIGAASGFHMDFGSGVWDGGPIGIPYNIVDASQVKHHYFGFYYQEESDAGPYPLPNYVAREYGSDHHVLVIDSSTCRLYEVYDASYNANTGRWFGGSGAIWDLNSNALRPSGWTSADAAGLPVLPGLVRYPEIEAALQQPLAADQMIPHALRFTVHDTAGYIWPARHLTAPAASGVPPMGARFRLKAGYDISGFSPEMKVILRTMKKYGIIIADNGSDWYVSGAPDQRWDNAMLHELDVLQGSDFEALDVTCMIVDAGTSGQADLSNCP